MALILNRRTKINPALMPARVTTPTTQPAPQPTVQQAHPATRRCSREGCNRKVRNAEKFTHCSGLCKNLTGMIEDMQQLCGRIDPEEATQLWSDTVVAADAITEIMQQRGRLIYHLRNRA